MTPKSPSSDDWKEYSGHASLGPAKRALDLVLGGLGMAILWPVFGLIALLVRLTSPGPVLYRRNVYGRGGRIFVMLKFRSMVENAHEILLRDPKLRQEYEENLKIEHDTRITPLGQFLRRTSLDELPQLFNVLGGDMSLVGPRVLGDIELERYGSLRNKILSVKPGLTGLWQVSGRQDTSFERRVMLDEAYIDSWSLRSDALILLRTVLAVVRMKGAR
jgi:lipopolysaccharide/colanic/teichoic acid biosynthesis glycosyltransferase